jgi:hypothetical protein
LNIKDNPTFKEQEMYIKGMEKVLSNKKSLRRNGMKTVDILKLESKLRKAKKELEELSSLPDRFNELLSEYGWFSYESLKHDLMKEVVELGSEQGAEKAQELLIDYYLDEEDIRIKINRLYKHKPFRIRRLIIKEALDNHFQKQYFSSVALFLTIIDGFVNDFKNTGFFASNTDLNAWDSIAAHSSGLSKIAGLINVGRNKTTEEKIDFPYRNGILHGRDLGYGNKLVSAKCLQIVLALSDWADAVIKMESGETKETYYEPPTIEEFWGTLSESVQKRKESQNIKSLISDLENRNLTIGIDIPESGSSNDYPASTPEKYMVQLIEFINKNNFGNIAKLVYQSSNPKTIGKLAGEFRESLKDITIKSFRIIEIEDTAPAATNISMEFELKASQNEFTHREVVRWLCIDAQGSPIPRNDESVDWKFINNFSFKWETFKYKIPKK